MADICEPLRKPTSARTELTWNATYQKIFEKAKSIIKEGICMKFYGETKPLYIEMDSSVVEMGCALLQTKSSTCCSRDKAPDNSILRPTVFSSKNLSSAEKRYSNIEREAIVILYGPEKLHHYCFVREVRIIIDCKPLTAILKKKM